MIAIRCERSGVEKHRGSRARCRLSALILSLPKISFGDRQAEEAEHRDSHSLSSPRFGAKRIWRAIEA